jgi:uncharacterized protein (TIGR02145 family)
MSIASEITRLQGVKSDILTAIADKGVTVPVGSALADCPDLIASITGGYTPIKDTTELFGKTYNTIKINGLEWICENLDYAWEGLNINSSNNSSPGARYTEQNESVWGWNGRKCGLQYNTAAKIYLQNNILPNVAGNWRVPSVTDAEKLITSVISHGFSNVGQSLSKTVEWGTYVGTDIIGFSELPCGGWANPGDDGDGQNWHMGLIDGGTTNIFLSNYNPGGYLSLSVNIGDYTPNYWHICIRLCRDL